MKCKALEIDFEIPEAIQEYIDDFLNLIIALQGIRNLVF